MDDICMHDSICWRMCNHCYTDNLKRRLSGSRASLDTLVKENFHSAAAHDRIRVFQAHNLVPFLLSHLIRQKLCKFDQKSKVEFVNQQNRTIGSGG